MAPNATECLKRQLCCIFTNPKRQMTHAWIISLVLVFVVFIVACVAASRIASGTGDSNDQAADTSASFSAIWTALLLIFISVLGTIIMRRYQTALSIGFLLGVIFIMTQQMLIIFAIFADRAQDQSASTTQIQSVEAMAVFAFFLFFIYAVFGSMLAVFRDDIIKQEISSVDPEEYRQSAPPEENQI